MEGKIHIRLENLEVDYEGSEEFIRQELPKILDRIVKFREVANSSPAMGSGAQVPKDGKTSLPKSVTTKTIAAKLQCKTGTELIIAAAAKISIADRTDRFSRNDLTRELKSAAGYFKTSYASNLTNYLSTLVKEQKLHEISTDTYSLPEIVKAELEKKLA